VLQPLFKPGPLSEYINAYPSCWRPDRAHLQIPTSSDPSHLCVDAALTCRASTSPPLWPASAWLRSAMPPCRHDSDLPHRCSAIPHPPWLWSAAHLCRRNYDPLRLHVTVDPTQRTDTQPFHTPRGSDPPCLHVAAAPSLSLSTKCLSVDKKMAEGLL
jgi:hypothetical protein